MKLELTDHKQKINYVQFTENKTLLNVILGTSILTWMCKASGVSHFQLFSLYIISII